MNKYILIHITVIRGRRKKGRMYGVFGYARKLLIVKVNSPPLYPGYFGVK
nr:MAG TPA: hypothetical protein [Caudoviricetes sp.]